MCGDQSASSPSELNHLIVEEEESQHDWIILLSKIEALEQIQFV